MAGACRRRTRHEPVRRGRRRVDRRRALRASDLTFTRAAFGTRGNSPTASSRGRRSWPSSRSTASSACSRCWRSWPTRVGGPGRRGQGPRDAARPRGVGAHRGLRARDARVPHARLRGDAHARAGARPRLRHRRRRVVLDVERPLGAWETVALILAGGAVVASGPISYLFNAPDFVRYLPAEVSGRAILWTVALGSGLIALLLSVMGVLLASRGTCRTRSQASSRSCRAGCSCSTCWPPPAGRSPTTGSPTTRRDCACSRSDCR